MKRMHAMPFGAEHRDGATRFALWAPGAPQVWLELGRESPRRVPLAAGDGGWHSVTLGDVAPGEAYAFRVREDAPAVPDPASRSNPWDVNGPSAVVDPRDFDWDDAGWRGRPWHEAVVYELHLGTFTRAGTCIAAIDKLDHLVDLGVTAIELMPVAEFAGARGWGYDGVLPFAPEGAYGTPAELKRLVAAAHARGLMVLVDVVYNHFGPEGNYLSLYAPRFFNPRHQTPWGAAINFDGDGCRPVRDFFVHNALYWIEEFHMDGLRMDAIHAIADDSARHVVTEIAAAVAAGPGRDRHVHVVLENDRNDARLLSGPGPRATAQWNDDAHHAFHVLASGEADGYYRDYADRPAWHLARTLAEGFSYQGEASAHRGGERRGEPSTGLALQAFVPFLQNHDQVGNRALGERLVALAPPEALRLAAATLLLAPSIPLLFMGEELGARTPFLYFCDFQGELADAVREGRRKEFAAFARFADPAVREEIPDPNAEKTFLDSKLPWEALHGEEALGWLDHYKALLALRAREIVPRIAAGARGTFEAVGATGVAVDWTLGDGSRLRLRANFGKQPMPYARPPGRPLHLEGQPPGGTGLEAWSGAWILDTD